jgi:hypothetical protein
MNPLQMFDYFDRLFGALLVSKTFAGKTALHGLFWLNSGHSRNSLQ